VELPEEKAEESVPSVCAARDRNGGEAGQSAAGSASEVFHEA
jgi:hypothetical protein